MALNGKVAVVSGGSRGIGREIVLALAGKGALVGFTYYRNPEAARRVEKEAENLPGEVKAFCVDMKSREQVRGMVKEIVNTWSGIDIVVNNAGICKDKSLVLMDCAEWNEVMDTNVSGMVHLTQAAIFYLLKKKSGRIVNISSISGISGIAGQTNYSASKAAIIGFTRSLAKEVAEYGICANAIAPGGVETDMVEGLSEKQKQNLLQNIPAKRLCKPEEVARVAVFLADNEMSPDYLTGSVICLDGGIGT